MTSFELQIVSPRYTLTTYFYTESNTYRNAMHILQKQTDLVQPRFKDRKININQPKMSAITLTIKVPTN